MSLLLRYIDVGSNTASDVYPFSNVVRKQGGYSTNSRTKLYFYINLEDLLGESYDKYNMFNFELLQIQVCSKVDTRDDLTFNNQVTVSGSSNFNFSYVFSGLDFINAPSSKTTLGQLTFIPPAYNFYTLFVNNYRNSKVSFYKPISPEITLGVELYSDNVNHINANGFIPSSWLSSQNQPWQPVNFLIKISPIEE